jgi:hypothetical protein
MSIGGSMRLPAGKCWPLLTLACTLAACDSDVVGPYEAAALRIEPASFTIDAGVSPAPSITVHFENTGDRSTVVRMCNLPDPNPPGAPLILQEQESDGSWQPVDGVVICANPDDGSDRVVAPGDRVQVGRLYPAPHSGRFRYQLRYTVAQGPSGMVTSPAFTVEFRAATAEATHGT